MSPADHHEQVRQPSERFMFMHERSFSVADQAAFGVGTVAAVNLLAGHVLGGWAALVMWLGVAGWALAGRLTLRRYRREQAARAVQRHMQARRIT